MSINRPSIAPQPRCPHEYLDGYHRFDCRAFGGRFRLRHHRWNVGGWRWHCLGARAVSNLCAARFARAFANSYGGGDVPCDYLFHWGTIGPQPFGAPSGRCRYFEILVLIRRYGGFMRRRCGALYRPGRIETRLCRPDVVYGPSHVVEPRWRPRQRQRTGTSLAKIRRDFGRFFLGFDGHRRGHFIGAFIGPVGSRCSQGGRHLVGSGGGYRGSGNARLYRGRLACPRFARLFAGLRQRAGSGRDYPDQHVGRPGRGPLGA